MSRRTSERPKVPGIRLCTRVQYGGSNADLKGAFQQNCAKHHVPKTRGRRSIQHKDTNNKCAISFVPHGLAQSSEPCKAASGLPCKPGSLLLTSTTALNTHRCTATVDREGQKPSSVVLMPPPPLSGWWPPCCSARVVCSRVTTLCAPRRGVHWWPFPNAAKEGKFCVRTGSCMSPPIKIRAFCALDLPAPSHEGQYMPHAWSRQKNAYSNECIVARTGLF
jgi:hypothetical protein